MDYWREIQGYNGKYSAGRGGEIKDNNRNVILPTYPGWHGYLRVKLNCKDKQVHRLIAETFLPRIEGCNIVNHKDENILNNSVNNLEWCDIKYNTNYSLNLHPERRKRPAYGPHPKIIVQYDIHNNIIKEWKNGISGIRKEYPNFHPQNIYKCCLGQSISAYGYKWKYKNREEKSCLT